MTHRLVFMEWTSTWFWEEQEREFKRESKEDQLLETSKRSVKKKLSSGLLKN